MILRVCLTLCHCVYWGGECRESDDVAMTLLSEGCVCVIDCGSMNVSSNKCTGRL